ncbi:hypothetical protein F959_01655 [Acinetobacter venetianus RAG-1 = CIP 110063]|uniref:Uncharacterized protein n=1 Tax=Acinetobacter venetianus (strain ATCC 31012 / DSM 23050 / BCRC 14357 / CCUG 45561 / CIP 110063 / KCTC 2702 / LMG 19082 / RAG-1) TaxID=1191460 RepID=N8ZYH0_ACIVR|nr:hypothetical protein [Acinetobacter venetianus]ENV36848.1 hypothetical protein F959_01655 [Acinetobacter venetianus RAG-1 = CIP 110063]
MTQENAEDYALTTDVGSDNNLAVEQFLGFAKSDISDEAFEQVLAGQEVEGVTAYKPATFYKISAQPTSPDYNEPFDIHIHFQDGPTVIDGVNGATNESLLKILIHRTQYLDSKFPSDQNKQAIAAMQTALAAFDARTAERQARGVEGQQAI